MDKNGTGSLASMRTDEMSLADLRKTLSQAERKLVRDSMNHIEKELIVDFEKLLIGVRTTRTNSSVIPRISLIPKGKKGWNVGLEVSSRISAKRKPMKDEYHLDDDGQLMPGFDFDPEPDGEDDEPASTGANGSGSGSDDQPSPATH